MAPDIVVASDLPAGFKAWPNRLGATSRTWECRKQWDGTWACVNRNTGKVRVVGGLRALAPKRR
jgi:hypothetical protein